MRGLNVNWTGVASKATKAGPRRKPAARKRTLPAVAHRQAAKAAGSEPPRSTQPYVISVPRFPEQSSRIAAAWGVKTSTVGLDGAGRALAHRLRARARELGVEPIYLPSEIVLEEIEALQESRRKQ